MCNLGTRDNITSIVFGSFTVVQGVMSIIGPLIVANLHDTSNEEKTSYGAFGYRNVEIFIGNSGAFRSSLPILTTQF